MSTSMSTGRFALGVTVNLDFAMIEKLTTIWQRLLQRPSVNQEDNFFDLGGSFEAADGLFAEIAQQCGRELPSATIYHAPTIAALARVLAEPALPRFSPFVPLKRGSAASPIHIVHGLAGIPRFSGLSAHIKTAHPIFGIQARGLDGLEPPFDSVEDMASLYLEALPEVQPEGPYFLIGYSFGGLVALEMAQRLTASGNEVNLLAMIDTFPDPQYLSATQRLRLVGRRARRYVTEIDRDHTLVKPVLGFAYRMRRRMRGNGNRPVVPFVEPSRLSLALNYLQVKEKAYVALARYRPRPYPGKIKFVKSGNDRYYPGNPVAVWSSLAQHVESATVPGNHLNIVTNHFESLGAVLTRYVEKASCCEPAENACP